MKLGSNIDEQTEQRSAPWFLMGVQLSTLQMSVSPFPPPSACATAVHPSHPLAVTAAQHSPESCSGYPSPGLSWTEVKDRDGASELGREG